MSKETITIAEIYNIKGSLNLNDTITLDLWSNLQNHYCKTIITCLGSKNVRNSTEDSLIVIGNDNIFYSINTSFYKTNTTESQHWGDWRVQPIYIISNNTTMDYVKYNIPSTVYLAFVGVISGCS